jgi:hypothetical protein
MSAGERSKRREREDALIEVEAAIGQAIPGRAPQLDAGMDVAGDDKADLVVYKDACGSDEVGDSIWWVYENTGSGFSSSPTEWTMPPDSLKSTAPCKT